MIAAAVLSAAGAAVMAAAVPGGVNKSRRTS
jgi:hypothetical protein